MQATYEDRSLRRSLMMSLPVAKPWEQKGVRCLSERGVVAEVLP